MKCQYCGKEQPQTDWKKETLLQMEAMGDNPNDFPYQPSPDKSVEQRAKEYADSILKEPDNAYVSLLVSEIRKAIESSYLAGASDKKGEAVEFGKFLLRNCTTVYSYELKEDIWEWCGSTYIANPTTPLTTEQAYTLYEQSKQKC